MAVTVRDLKAEKKFQKEPSWIRYLPYSYHVTDHVISTINGEYLTLFKVRGRTHETASNADLLNWHRDLNQLVKSIGNEHVQFWTHEHHRKVKNYKRGQYDLTFARLFDESYAKLFDDVPLMVNDLYLVVVYNPVGDLTQRIFARFDRPTQQDLRELQAGALAALEEVTDQLMGVMRPYGIERLGIYYRDERGRIIQDTSGEPEDVDDDDDGDLLATPDIPAASAATPEPKHQRAFSTAMEWLSFLANGEASIVPVCQDRIRTYLMQNRPVTSIWGDVVQIRAIDRNFYSAAVEIRDYDDETEPGQLNTLMEADFEYVLTQSFACMSMGAARQFLTNQQKALMETRDPSATQIAQMSAATDGVVSRRFVMGWHHATVHVFGESAKEAQANARKARVMLNQCAITATPVGLASEAAYYAKLPGNATFIPRASPINSWNFLCFSPFHNFLSGKPADNPWGEAVALFKTVAGTPLFFNFHVTPPDEMSFGKRPAGNTLILGRVGSGKTTLLNALLTLSTKFKPRMFIFDKDQGMKPLVKALKGHYTVVREGEYSGWQPLQMEPTRANTAMCKRLVRLCAEISLGAQLEHADVQDINDAVEALMGADSKIERGMRNMTTLVQHIPAPYQTTVQDRPTLVALLQPWCRGGEHGWLFDNDADTLDLTTHDAYAFDITEFVTGKEQDAPPTRTPMLMYLQYRVRSSIDGKRRSMQIFDEFAQYLDDPVLALEVKRGLKTDRKKDCIYLFSTQEPNDALDSLIGKTIMQSIVTKILLENPDADPDDYMKRLNLTPAEYETFRMIPEGSRQFLVKQGSQSAMAEMVLRGMDKEISILSGTPDNSERLDHIIESLGTDDPDVWLPKYWEAVLNK